MKNIPSIEDIANLIPKGHKNAIPLESVVSMMIHRGWISGSTADRQARKLIERAGYEYTICNLQDGEGYFRPTADEIADFRKWIKQEEARLSKISKRLSMGRKLFEDYVRGRLDEQEVGNE